MQPVEAVAVDMEVYHRGGGGHASLGRITMQRVKQLEPWREGTTKTIVVNVNMMWSDIDKRITR
jgi:hypothetical protein